MFHLSTEAVKWYFSRDNIGFMDREKAERICNMRLLGMTYEAIGKKVGLEKSRVREYCLKVDRMYQRDLRLRAQRLNWEKNGNKI